MRAMYISSNGVPQPRVRLKKAKPQWNREGYKIDREAFAYSDEAIDNN